MRISFVGIGFFIANSLVWSRYRAEYFLGVFVAVSHFRNARNPLSFRWCCRLLDCMAESTLMPATAARRAASQMLKSSRNFLITVAIFKTLPRRHRLSMGYPELIVRGIAGRSRTNRLLGPRHPKPPRLVFLWALDSVIVRRGWWPR